MHERGFVVAPSWYAEGIGPPAISYEDALATQPRLISALAGRIALVKGVALAIACRRGTLAVIKGTSGSLSAIAASALLNRDRRVIVLEFILRPESRSSVRATLREAGRRLVEAPCIRRTMAVGHVLTDVERTEYAAKYGLSAERLVKVRWPLCRTGAGSPVEITRDRRRVLSSGRAGSDWETLFRAADGANWLLTVICSSIDEQRVRNLSRGRADVHAELDRAAHDSILRASDVYVMAMKERGVSAGHVRLMAAVEAGIPVVASEIRALDEYVVPGETAVMIPPGAASALRREVDALLEDPSRRQTLRDAALARARAWTHEHYFERMRALILPVGAS